MARFILLLFLTTSAGIYVEAKEMQLKQILIFSRHNIRTPLTENLQELTSKKLPKWESDVGFLTKKGALVESYMGEYFASWLQKEKLLTNKCPEENSVYLYSNNVQRTIESARSFAKGAFKGCNVTTHFNTYKNEQRDPVFYPAILNDTKEFKAFLRKKMQEKLESFDLKEPYLELNRILDLKNSEICKKKSVCDLTKERERIYLELGKEPDVMGPLYIGNAVVDLFIMSFYNGFPDKSIAWGEINSKDQWNILTSVTRANQNIRFNYTDTSRILAKPLLEYITDIFLKDKSRFTLLVGHDSNQNNLLAALNIKPYFLPDQFEEMPVGGKIVFQKWYDSKQCRYFLKINYVYPTFDQLRNGKKYSEDNPLRSVILELKECAVNEKGLCPWEDFIKVLRRLK